MADYPRWPTYISDEALTQTISCQKKNQDCKSKNYGDISINRKSANGGLSKMADVAATPKTIWFQFGPYLMFM